MACMAEPHALAQVRRRLADTIGTVDSARLLGGTAYLVVVDGRRLVAKFGAGCRDEAEGLRQLGAAAGGPPVPAVLVEETDLLVTVAVDQVPRTAGHVETLGAAWRGCTERRFRTGVAVRPGWAPAASTRPPGPTARLSTALVCSTCPPAAHSTTSSASLPHDWTKSSAPGGPVLVHGDLWWGNVLSGSDGRSWLIDPSVHGGHAEEDLAMLALFGAVPDRLFQAYGEVQPLEDGWEERVGLFQLAPLLVHAVLFGGAYRARAEAVARGFT